MKNIFFDFLQKHLVQHVHLIVNVHTLEVAFLEVLSRVQYENKTYYPNDFLQNISEDQKYILAKVQIEKISQFQEKYPQFSFSMNISSLEINKGFDKFLDDLASNSQRINTQKFVIEVTESSIIEKNTIEKLRTLQKKHGYRFALDDFGNKYSSISQIKHSNGLFEFIKIDGSLVDGIDECTEAKDLYVDVLKIAKGSKKKIVTEYISNKEKLEIIKTHGSDYAQGFLFGMPNTIENIVKLIDKNNIFKGNFKC